MNSTALSVLLLALSSCVMMVAWYAHLRFASVPLWRAILVSWAIAFIEYCLQVPGNRIGHRVMPAAQLRVIAEFFALVAFMLFSYFYLGETLSVNYLISFALILLAVYFAVSGPFP